MIKPMIRKKSHAVADLESKIVHRIHSSGGLSRVELSRALKVVASTSGIYVDRLIAAGWLVETAAPHRGLGRPPLVLRLNPKAGRFIGVDFDARHVQAVAVDFTQSPLAETRRVIPARSDVQEVVKVIAEVIREVLGPRRRDLLGIGLGVPGPVDPARGLALGYAHLRDWVDVPIGPMIAEKFAVPVSVENNLRSMALAELHGAAGRGLRNLVCLGIRSGIGSGIIVDGRLLTGSANLAGEIGRWTCLPPEESAANNPPPTIEDLASISALLAKAELTNVADLITRLERGDRRIQRQVAEAARVHAWTLGQLASLLDPELMIVAGPLVESKPYCDLLFQAAAICGGNRLTSRLQMSNLGPYAGARGAAAVAFQLWKPEP